MLSNAVLFAIVLVGIGYYSLSISLKIGDIFLNFQVWQIGLIFFGICGLYMLAKRILRRVFQAFHSYRGYLESFNPSRAIMMVIDHKLSLHKDILISYENMSTEKQIYIELLNFLIQRHPSRKILSTHIHGDTLCDIDEIEVHMRDGSYVPSIKLLKGIMKEYGCIQWVYDRLRTCYLALNRLDDLDHLNHYAIKSGIQNIDANEVKLMQMKAELTKTKDMTKKLAITERIYKIAPCDTKNLHQYLLCLQSFAQFAAGINLIKNTTESSPEFISLACEFFDMEDADRAVQNAYKMKSSTLKYVLLFNAALRKGDHDMIEHAIINLHNFDPMLSRIFELRWHQENHNSVKLNKLVTTISKTYLLDGIAKTV